MRDIAAALRKLAQHLIDPFPDSRQSTDFSCGAASVQSILAYYGEDFREADLSTILKADTEIGIEPENIAKFLIDRDFQVDYRQMGLSDLKSYVDQNVPVMILFQAWSEEPVDYEVHDDAGHYAVVIGYDAEYFYLDDPVLNGARGKLKYDELLKRWHGSDIDLPNLGIAVFGKEPKFNLAPRDIE